MRLIENSFSIKKVLKLEVKSASIYTVSTFITQFGSFLIVPLFWQELTVYDYGIIGVIEMIGSFLGMFIGLQMEVSITRFFIEWEPSERNWRIGNIWVFSTLSTLIIGGFFLLVLSFINNFLFNDVEFYPHLFLGLVGFLISRLTVVPFAVFRMVNLPFLYAMLSICIFIIQTGFNIFYVLILKMGLTGYLISGIIGNLISVIIVFAIMFRFAKPCINLNALKESLRFSLPQIPASVISGLTNLLDRFLLQKFASIEIMGIYTICLKFINLVLHLHNSLKISYVPFMLKNLVEEKSKSVLLVNEIRFFYLAVLMTFGLFIVLFINDFVFWIDRIEYFVIIEWMPYLIYPVIISTFTIYFSPGLFLSKRSDLSWIPSFGQFIVVFVSGIVFIPDLEMWGVVFTRFLSVISLFIINYYLSQKYFPISLNWHRFFLVNFLFVLVLFFSQLIYSDNIVINAFFKFTLLFVFFFVSLRMYEKSTLIKIIKFVSRVSN